MQKNLLTQQLNLKIVLIFFLSISLFNISFTQNPLSKEEAERKIPPGISKPAFKQLSAATGQVDKARVEPPFWWTGMENQDLQVLIYDENIGDAEVSIKYPGVEIVNIDRVENKNYLFVNLKISKVAQPGNFDIKLKNKRKKKSYSYTLQSRTKDKLAVQGINAADFIYLIMPDRFANGDTSNDSVEGMTQTGIDRQRMYYRHGGDLQGIIDQLDYIEELGVTALWLNPVQTNDQPYESYHGYAVTDHYNIDPRFGDNALYKKLVDACHQRGIKVIMDIIHNHIGSEHWMFKDLPSTDFVHEWDEFTRSKYRAAIVTDPYASEVDTKQNSNGWFDYHMPDMNQQNKLLAKYFIQNNIWWVEYSGLDAYRVDTYFYPDLTFMADWAKALNTEYPTLGIFGETWVHGPAIQAQFTKDNHLRGDYNSNLPAVTDFQLYYAINEALDKQQGWTEGVTRIYYTLAQDFLYEDPYRNVVFLDNHDLSRFFSMVKEDVNKFKSGIAFLMTIRGIPMLYYGTEILMKNYTDPDGKVREDFPGGWENDKANKFTKAGRTEEEQAIFSYISTLSNYRKNNEVLQTGKLMQFVPEDGIYVYFRYNKVKTVMVVMNTNNESKTVDTKRYKERMTGFSTAKNIIDDSTLTDLSSLKIEKNSIIVLELK